MFQVDSALTARLPYGYSYDSNGRLKTFTTAEGTQTFGHDDFGQLTAADQPGAQPDESYGYDATGNRTNGGYQTGRPNLLRSDGRRWFDYDANGNRTRSTDLVSGEVTSYAYDHDNRLVGVTVESSGGVLLKEVRYEYDLFGRQVARIGPDATGTQTIVERFAHAGDQVLLKFNLAGQVVERYLYGPQVDQLVAVSRIGQAIPVVWALSDHLNTVRDLIDSTGAGRLHVVYDSFGRVLLKDVAANDPAAAGLASFNILYTGRDYDAATGLYYYRARWYDPAVGRFISRDPIGLGDGPNPFAYVHNGPVSATDPTGEFAWAVVGGIVGGVHALSMSIARGDSLEWMLASTVLGALGGAINPISALTSAGGALLGAGVGGLIGGKEGAYLGAEAGGLVGMIGGGFGDAATQVGAFGKFAPCVQHLRNYLPTMQAIGAGAGAVGGRLATGTWQGSLNWANLGALAGGIAGGIALGLKPCFAAGTPIRTAEGSKPIEEIQAGDYVLSRDENDPNGPVLLKLVEETFVRTGRIWVLRIDGREIRTTGEHPFYAKDKGWKALAELDITDVLLSEYGRWLTIESLEDTGKYETVYNFRVADFHTYFVGGNGWNWSVWTHNVCSGVAALLERGRAAQAARGQAVAAGRATDAVEAVAVSTSGTQVASGFRRHPGFQYVRPERVRDYCYGQRNGFLLRPSHRDFAFPGGHLASHAEKKLIIHLLSTGGDLTIGVNFTICTNCMKFIQYVARREGRSIVIAGGQGTFAVFGGTGNITRLAI